MHNRKKIIDLYNAVSEEKIDEIELNELMPKLYMIINKTETKEIEIIELIDTLKEIKRKCNYEKITPEIVDLVIKLTKDNKNELEDCIYFGMLLKHVILPFDKNICDNDYDFMLFLSEFEIFIELASKYLNNNEMKVLDKYNHELKQIIMNYKDMKKIYNNCVNKDILLNQMMSHFAVILYFNLERFDYDYDLLILLLEKLINNYYEFVDYCYSHGIDKNYNILNNNIEKEYKISYDMLNYIYNNKNKEKIKRK